MTATSLACLASHGSERAPYPASAAGAGPDRGLLSALHSQHLIEWHCTTRAKGWLRPSAMQDTSHSRAAGANSRALTESQGSSAHAGHTGRSQSRQVHAHPGEARLDASPLGDKEGLLGGICAWTRGRLNTWRKVTGLFL